MSTLYLPNSPVVASEVIDGEAVIMNLQSGQYYSAAASGGFIWRCIELGQPPGHIATLLSQRYQLDPGQATETVSRFLGGLIEAELVRAGELAQPLLALGSIDGFTGHAQFIEPVLNTFSDMQDLLLIDPIHDADAQGWPSVQAWPDAADQKPATTRLE